MPIVFALEIGYVIRVPSDGRNPGTANGRVTFEESKPSSAIITQNRLAGMFPVRQLPERAFEFPTQRNSADAESVSVGLF